MVEVLTAKIMNDFKQQEKSLRKPIKIYPIWQERAQVLCREIQVGVFFGSWVTQLGSHPDFD